MSDISYNLSITGAKGGNSLNTGYGAGSFDMVGDDMLQASQTIQSGTEALNLGDVTAAGFLYVKNNAASGFVTLSYNSNGTTPFAKVTAGKLPTCVQPTSLPVYATATASTKLTVAVAQE